MTKTKNKDLLLAEKYEKADKKFFKWKNPLFIIMYDDVIGELLPELTFEQRVKVMKLMFVATKDQEERIENSN